MSLFQLRWMTKPVQRDVLMSGNGGKVFESKKTSIEKVLQYRTRPDEDCEFTSWLDVTEDFYGEPPAGSY